MAGLDWDYYRNIGIRGLDLSSNIFFFFFFFLLFTITWRRRATAVPTNREYHRKERRQLRKWPSIGRPSHRIRTGQPPFPTLYKRSICSSALENNRLPERWSLSRSMASCTRSWWRHRWLCSRGPVATAFPVPGSAVLSENYKRFISLISISRHYHRVRICIYFPKFCGRDHLRTNRTIGLKVFRTKYFSRSGKKNMEYLQYLRFSSYFAFSRDEAPFRGTFSNGIHRYERVDSIGELVVTPVIHENEIPKEEIGWTQTRSG